MLLYEFMQTSAALSGLICLMVALTYAKRQLKQYTGR
jgi:hypothetical protein